jgi:transcriptional regulator with XRE-family HTH domain
MGNKPGEQMDDRELKDAESREFGRRVREELARRRVSRQALADMARISLSTLEKALAGTRPFTLASKLRIEEALGLRQDAAPSVPPAAAPERLGAYARPAVRWLEASYLTVRPSFKDPGAIYTYVTEIRWDDDAGHLIFAEHQRMDSEFEQHGEVSLPNLSGHTYLTTNDTGQHRLIVLSRPTISGAMHGLLATLEVGHGSQLVPACCPIVLTPMARQTDPQIGVIAEGTKHYDAYRALLEQTTSRDFARFHL